MLGPFLRFALWVQGCPRRCPGCMTPDARPFHGGTAVEASALAERICMDPDTEGITVSGGEPVERERSLLISLFISPERQNPCKSPRIGL